ncbi:MAG: hypothetical protein HY728_05965, partial [Candidatus Rokubacteria bacterium]|nr:hypothetical protein [Candidatus Rokubacteria bacterium]
MSGARVRASLFVLALTLPPLAAPAAPARAHGLTVAWHPARPRAGDVAWLHVRDVPAEASVEGSVAGRPLTFFPYAGGQAALVGFDVDAKPGLQTWRVAVLRRGQPPETAQGQVRLGRREFPVQRLTLPRAMVDLDPDTERRAVAEGERLRTLYRMMTPERLWRGRFTRPVAGSDPGT